MQRFGIDGRYIVDHFPGIGRYTYNLAKALGDWLGSNSLVLYYDPRLKNTHYHLAQLAACGVELRSVDAAPFSWREQTVYPWWLRGQRLGLLHSPYYIKPYLTPCLSVVTIHDVISCLYPEYLPSLWARLAFHLASRLALVSSRLVITDSEAAKSDLTRFFGVPSNKVWAIPLAADDFAWSPKGEDDETPLLTAPYLLYVGINKPHKNLVRLVQAYALSKVTAKLVIAGAEDLRYPQHRRAVARLGVQDKVVFLGPVSQRKLAQLYRSALCFVFPSLAEGFGLPVLEAMTSGCPVICSRIPALEEVVAEAALLVDPLDVAALAEALAQVAEGVPLREVLKQKALERAKAFSWERTAQATLAVYREAVG